MTSLMDLLPFLASKALLQLVNGARVLVLVLRPPPPATAVPRRRAMRCRRTPSTTWFVLRRGGESRALVPARGAGFRAAAPAPGRPAGVLVVVAVDATLFGDRAVVAGRVRVRPPAGRRRAARRPGGPTPRRVPGRREPRRVTERLPRRSPAAADRGNRELAGRVHAGRRQRRRRGDGQAERRQRRGRGQVRLVVVVVVIVERRQWRLQV